jgi:hypothetical protein
MNRIPDVELVLREFLADDSTAAPDHVLDVIEERIWRQPQQRSWRVSWRDSDVTAYLKPLLAVAAVVAIAVAGIAILRPSSGPGTTAPTTAPPPSAEPTPAPTDAPSPGASFAYPPAAALPAGSHETRLFKPAFTFTVPDGWINDGDTAESPGNYGFYSLFPDTPANRAEFERTGNAANGILIVSNLVRPWFMCEAWEDNRGATSAEMAAAVMSNEALVTTGLTDVAIGGLTGKQFDVRLNPDWTETCPDGTPTSVLADGRTRSVFLDRPGSPVLVIWAGSLHAADFEAHVAEAMPIIQSFEFDLGAEASPS